MPTDGSAATPRDAQALTQARARIAAAYDPDLLQAAGHQLANLLHGHFQLIQASQGRVLNWADPLDNIVAAGRTLDDAPAGMDRDGLIERFHDLVSTILARGQNLHDPRYIGHQVPAPVPIAGLVDAVGSVTNQVMAIYEMGPWATAVEQAVIQRLGQLIGWSPGTFAGLATHGGSLANLTALLTARNVRLRDSWERGIYGTKQPVMIVHSDAHYCINRSAGILGLGTGQVIRAQLDEKRKIDVSRLEDSLQELRKSGRPVVAVVACACATPIGAFDRLDQIAEVCARYDVWLHVDAAHGGAVCFSPRHRHLLRGLDRADSFIWDAHKMLFVPALCAFVFYRDQRHCFETFRQDAPYLFDPSAPGLAAYDSGLVTLECTKRAVTFGLWGIWSLFGSQLFADMVDVTFDVAQQFYQMLCEAPDFEPLHVPECNIVAFRYLPDWLLGAPAERIGQFQFDLRRELIQSGKFYIVQTAASGIGALRVSVCNPLTTVDHMQGLMGALREQGKRMRDEG
jgi:L-2,4-diaminobutyrate decarboxylase